MKKSERIFIAWTKNLKTYKIQSSDKKQNKQTKTNNQREKHSVKIKEQEKQSGLRNFNIWLSVVAGPLWLKFVTLTCQGHCVDLMMN